MVELSQNRVDIMFEIGEGQVQGPPDQHHRQRAFSDGELRGEMLTKQARLTNFLSSNTSYDPDNPRSTSRSCASST